MRSWRRARPRRDLRAGGRARRRCAQPRRARRDRGRDPRVGGHRPGAAARVPRARPVDLHRDARRRGAVGRVGRRRAPRGARGRRVGLHRFRRGGRRRRGDARRLAARAAGDLDRPAQRRRARHPRRRGRHARPPRAGGGRRPARTSTRSATTIASAFGELVGPAVRGGRARRVPGVRDGGAGPHRADDVLGRARRRAARVAAARLGRPAGGADRRDRRDGGDRVPRPVARPALRVRSAASSRSGPRRSTPRSS